MRIKAMLLTVTASMLMAGSFHRASAGDNAFGLRLGFATRNSAPVAGLWFQHSFNSHFRLSPTADYYFRSNHTDALALNCNAQFPFALGQSRFQVYPFAGLNYTSWNLHHVDSAGKSDATPDDVTTRLNRFGINAGAGLEYQVTPTLKLNLEAKATLIKAYSSGCFTIGIGYCF